jgi:large subunit ribosomal protein L10
MSTVKCKNDIVSEIKENIEASVLVVAANCRGLTSNKTNAFRVKLRDSGAIAKVYKNTLMRLAFKELSISYPDDLLIGPTLLIHTREDVVSLSKAIVGYLKESDAVSIKGGLLQKSYVDEAGIRNLATLPSKEELIAKTVSMIKSPITGFVLGVSSPLRGLVAVLKQIEIKKQEA